MQYDTGMVRFYPFDSEIGILTQVLNREQVPFPSDFFGGLDHTGFVRHKQTERVVVWWALYLCMVVSGFVVWGGLLTATPE